MPLTRRRKARDGKGNKERLEVEKTEAVSIGSSSGSRSGWFGGVGGVLASEEDGSGVLRPTVGTEDDDAVGVCSGRGVLAWSDDVLASASVEGLGVALLSTSVWSISTSSASRYHLRLRVKRFHPSRPRRPFCHCSFVSRCSPDATYLCSPCYHKIPNPLWPRAYHSPNRPSHPRA